MKNPNGNALQTANQVYRSLCAAQKSLGQIAFCRKPSTFANAGDAAEAEMIESAFKLGVSEFTQAEIVP
jgi:hypothetical protein